MCSFLGVFLSFIYLASTLSDNGSVIDSGFHTVYKRIVSRKIQFNDQPDNIEELNTFYDSSFRDDLAEVDRSIKRTLYLSKYSDQEFRFEKPFYNVTTTTDFIGLLTAFKVITALKNSIQFGLLTDDAYVNQVFRIGPTTGLLYSDTKLKNGTYNFKVTADIIDLQLHAIANVTVDVTLPPPKKALTFNEAHSIVFPVKKQYSSNFNEKVPPVQSPQELHPNLQSHKVTTENSAEFYSYIPFDISRNLDKEDPDSPFSSLWRRVFQQNSKTQTTNDRALNKELLEKAFSSQSKIKLLVPNELFRYQRAIPRGVYAASVDETPSTTSIDNATVTSIKIHEESLLVDVVMSSFVLFVTTFAVVILIGSLVYFVYKRIRKCGDYSVDDDNIKYVDEALKKEIILRTDLKNHHFLCVSEINQKNVTDSIVITKAKLQGHPPSVFTIQKCYEDHQAQAKTQSSANDNDDVFIVDMTQMSTNSQDDVYNTITLQTFTHSTPAITATLIGAPPPVSILSSSRRSSIVSSKKDGLSMGSEEIGPNGEMRRKSVTFSDIVELYQIKGN